MFKLFDNGCSDNNDSQILLLARSLRFHFRDRQLICSRDHKTCKNLLLVRCIKYNTYNMQCADYTIHIHIAVAVVCRHCYWCWCRCWLRFLSRKINLLLASSYTCLPVTGCIFQNKTFSSSYLICSWTKCIWIKTQ